MVLSGGYHDLPMSDNGILSQKNSNSLMDLLDNLTLVLLRHPSTECKSEYKLSKCNFVDFTAKEVDYKYPTILANSFLRTKRLDPLVTLSKAFTLVVIFYSYLGVNKNNFLVTSN